MNVLFNPKFKQEHELYKQEFATQLATTHHSPQTLMAFQNIIIHHHQHNRRTFAWRETISPYHVVVSEIMLQQTQTDRVAPKFNQFITALPTFQDLAHAPFETVLRLWKGLGYNRRAMALHKIAQRVTTEYAGNLPSSPEILETFPGIGKATARSIVTFAFNQQTMFIETNIRTVFIYFFFTAQKNVSDKELEPLVTQTVDASNPREWYYALMDYGVMLKKTVGNVSRLSAHYNRQSPFQGSDRQIRGMILQELLDNNRLLEETLVAQLNKDPERVHNIVEQLLKEGLIKKIHHYLCLP